MKVKVYEPIEIDSVLLAWNKEYPNVGIQVSQKTEFNPFSETPVAETVTDKDGEWEIKGLPECEYHVVFDAGEKGFTILYNQSMKSFQVNLKNAVILEGGYSSPINIPANSVCVVKGIVNLNMGASLTIGSGSVIIFDSDAKLVVYDKVVLQGTVESPIFIFANYHENIASIVVENANNVSVSHSYFLGLEKGLYCKNIANVDINYSRFKNSENCFEFFACMNINVYNNIISDGNIGIIMNNSPGSISFNYILKCSEIGIQTVAERDKSIINNVIALNSNGIQVNLMNAFGVEVNKVNVSRNDFIQNNIHVKTFLNTRPSFNYNNFLTPDYKTVVTVEKASTDTLDFRYNFWDTNSVNEISEMIVDYYDRSGEIKGDIVDYSGFLIQKVNKDN